MPALVRSQGSSPRNVALLVAGAGVLVALLSGCGGSGSGPGADGSPEAGPDDAGPARFSELYRDYFGPTGRASCAGDGACHGGDHVDGSLASGFVCGDIASACRASMVATGLVSRQGAPAVEATRLYIILRKPDGFGSMPRRPEGVTFSPREMARVASWIAAELPDD